MKTIQQAMLEEIYLQADKIAKENGAQIVKSATTGNFGRQFIITLEQLENILKVFED